MDDIINLREVKEYLRLHEMTVYRMAKKGLIPAFKVGSQWRFRLSALDEWMLNLIQERAKK